MMTPIVHLFSQRWLRSHFSVFFGFGFVVVLCVLSVCLPFFVFCFDGTAHWTLYWSITSAFEAIDV